MDGVNVVKLLKSLKEVWESGCVQWHPGDRHDMPEGKAHYGSSCWRRVVLQFFLFLTSLVP